MYIPSYVYDYALQYNMYVYIYTVIGIYVYNVYSALYLFVVVGKSHVVQVVARRF